MIINRQISEFSVFSYESIRSALKKIESNEVGLILGISEDGILDGVLTDGDFRRWIVQTNIPNLDQPVLSILNRDFKYCYITDNDEKISSFFSNFIQFVPLLDSQKRLVAIAMPRRKNFKIQNHWIGESHQAFIIAEIGNNHNGNIEIAKKLVDAAADSKVDCIKFQMRHLDQLYSNGGSSHDAKEDLGSQYTLDLLAKYQLSNDNLLRMFDYCYKKNILPLCTPWDLKSLHVLEKYGMHAYKVASADLTNHEIINELIRIGKPLIASTGMSTEAEIVESTKILKGGGIDFALLHCNSTYPAPFKDINLKYMKTLEKIGNCPVGYSSHDRGINVCIAAVSLGAKIIEKHITLDRNMEGIDHRVSLLPDELTKMVIAIREAEQALGTDAERRLSQGEMINREVLGKSLSINCDLLSGEIIKENMIEIKSPGRGLAPYRKNELIGKLAFRNFKNGDLFFNTDLNGNISKPRTYKFSRPFGIPVRFHDIQTLAKHSNFDLLEFHLSYKDLEENVEKYFTDALAMDFVVHAPELFQGDHLLDLCSLDIKYRERSIEELNKVVILTRKLKKYFKKSSTPRIVVNMGGFTLDTPLSEPERKIRYSIILESLKKINLEGINILPQTMPPFPWHFGGQRFQNLFMYPDETLDFCNKNNFKICLDISHSKLTCNHHELSFAEFLKKVGPITSHYHIADCSGVDGEGLQIGSGDIDFHVVAEILNKVSPNASFIPEIWQGHKNTGEGFWIALDKLETYL